MKHYKGLHLLSSTSASPPVRLNKISSVVPDEPDLLRHVTQLDVRDNRLTELDACVFPKLEMLHCERNRIACLKAKGSFLKGIYASSNGGFFFPPRGMCVVSKDAPTLLSSSPPL